MILFILRINKFVYINNLIWHLLILITYFILFYLYD